MNRLRSIPIEGLVVTQVIATSVGIGIALFFATGLFVLEAMAAPRDRNLEALQTQLLNERPVAGA